MIYISDDGYKAIVREFSFIMKKYIIPLLPIRIKCSALADHITRKREESQYNRLVNYDKASGMLTIVPQKKNPAFTVDILLPAGKNYVFRATEAILAEIVSVTSPKGIYEYEESASGGYAQLLDRLFDDNYIYLESITDIAFEKGLSSWLGGTDACGLTIFRLLHKLDNWTRKTYEGKHFSFGVIIDKELECGSMDYIGFLNNRNSALVSDGVFSSVYLDKNGKLIKSLYTMYDGSDYDYPDLKTDDVTDDGSEQSVANMANKMLAPYKYAGFASVCRDNKIGIISLESGDILIIKDSALIFGKRNDEWSFFDPVSVIDDITSFLSEDDPDADRTKMWEYSRLAKEIYKTLIDVSFSYTGGCLGIVKNTSAVSRLIDKNKIVYEDYLAGKYEIETDDIGRVTDSDAERKLALASLIWYDKKPRDFVLTNRKLRMECAAFDGAMLIDASGRFITVGTIVKVEGGGTGGRTLAARSIAKLGMGIKISADGDITAYRCKDKEAYIAFSIN